MLYLYYGTFSKTRNKGKDRIMMFFALSLPLLMDTHAFYDGTLWVTGAMNYSWITAFGLVAFYPVLFYVIRKTKPHWAITTIGITSGIIAASSQEQIGLSLSAISLIMIIYLFTNRNHHGVKKIPFYALTFFGVFAASFLFGILAPGNEVRLHAEVAHWLPDFYTIPLLEHVNYGYRWILDAIINHTGLLLIGSWIMTTGLFIKKQKKDKLDYIFMTMIAAFSLFALAKGFSMTEYWTNFYATWKPQLPGLLSYAVFVPWTIALIVTILSPIVLYRKSAKGRLLSTLYCVAIASASAITLSPTVYASGVRTLYVPSMLILIILYTLLDDILNKYNKSRYLLVLLILLLALSQYILLGIKVSS
jgi:hypothetical protein